MIFRIIFNQRVFTNCVCLKKQCTYVAGARSESVVGQLMCINYQLICKAKIKIVLRGESCFSAAADSVGGDGEI